MRNAFFERAHGMGRKFGGGHGRGGRETWGAWQATRTRRGDIKYLILDVLAEAPRHGYDVITSLEEKSGGRYRPSAGSVYPTLQMLEEGGFITGATADGKRVFTIADKGRELLAARGAEAAAPDEDESVNLRGAVRTLAVAVMQSARVVDGAGQAKVREILDRARREIYALLAESE